jgi:hypothetical protein
MSTDFQLNQVRELLSNLDPNNEVALKIKEVLNANPSDQLLKKWDKKLEGIKLKDKKILAQLLENTYNHVKAHDEEKAKTKQALHKKEVEELKKKLQATEAFQTDEAISSILKGQLAILEQQKPPAEQDDYFMWRFVNLYDEVLKFWDSLTIKDFVGVQAISQPNSVANALRFIESTATHEMPTVEMKFQTESILTEKLNVEVKPSTKVSGEKLANMLSEHIINTIFKKIVHQAKNNHDHYITPNQTNIMASSEATARLTKRSSANTIIANKNFFDKHLEDKDQLQQSFKFVQIEAIQDEYFILAYKGQEETDAGAILSLYELFKRAMDEDEADPQYYIAKFNLCTDFKGIENYYRIHKKPTITAGMTCEKTSCYSDVYKENMHDIDHHTNVGKIVSPREADRQNLKEIKKDNIKSTDFHKAVGEENRTIKKSETQECQEESYIDWFNETMKKERKNMKDLIDKGVVKVVPPNKEDKKDRIMAKLERIPTLDTKQKTLDDMLELGDITIEEHEEIGKEALGVEYLIAGSSYNKQS